MPQLDTSTWFTTIISMILALFILFQSKMSNHSYYSNPSLKTMKLTAHSTPWEKKWTKIYLPHSLPLH
uniref:ATP synthase complex subunit 8 n=1 Tax=Pteromys volans TaxID=55152 RepID=K7NV24_PTEVO|nr:ATP synthase F0 subunit 8 [Pteromys volans]AEX68556.1 ATP synthase F0 subunit 8 [Pteromys volans]QCF39423.1 ATP synthase F0 subunit 8 [Pteromys volans]QQL92576.1 ATP synthase F0 subunit 8 [Pteromys volans]